jgi:hypothetical protein
MTSPILLWGFAFLRLSPGYTLPINVPHVKWGLYYKIYLCTLCHYFIIKQFNLKASVIIILIITTYFLNNAPFVF